MIKLKPIIPKDAVLDARKLKRAQKNALEGAAKGALVDFKVTAQTWKHKPDFVIEKPSDNERIVGTNDEIYGYVEEGTKPHVIVARGKALAFPSGHKAKTRPRVIGSSGGGAKGATVFTRRVQHPGTDAREFSEVIAEKWQEQLPMLLQRAIDAELS